MWIYNLLPTIILLFYPSLAKEAVENAQAHSYSDFKCLKDKGFNKSLIKIKGFHSNLDMDAVSSIPAARNADL